MNLPFDVAITSALTAAYIITFPVALGANILLVYIVLKKPTMKTTTNYLFANLAAVNLLVAVFIIPYAMRNLYVGDAWFEGALGEISCRLVHFAFGTSIAGSILSLIAISLDQFYAILFPIKRIVVVRNIRIMTGGVWISSAVLMSPYLAMFGVRGTTRQHECVYLVRKRIVMEIHFSFMFVFWYAFPLVLIATMYSLIARKLWFRTVHGNIHSIHRQAAELSKRRVIRMLVIVTATFALCWLPLHVFHMCVAFEPHVTRNGASHWWLIILFIAHVNSAVNPCLEIVLNRNFRAESFKLWTTWRTFFCENCSRAVREEHSYQRNSGIRKMSRFKSVENLVERIARKRGRLYNLNGVNNRLQSTPISLMQFTYFNKAVDIDN